MPANELPLYPTPQQATYTMSSHHPSGGSSRKSSKTHASSSSHRSGGHSSSGGHYAHLQPQATQPYQQNPPRSQYQQQPGVGAAPTPHQYYQQSHAPPPPHHHQAPPASQPSGYHPQAAMQSPMQAPMQSPMQSPTHQYAPVPPPQQYYQPQPLPQAPQSAPLPPQAYQQQHQHQQPPPPPQHQVRYDYSPAQQPQQQQQSRYASQTQSPPSAATPPHQHQPHKKPPPSSSSNASSPHHGNRSKESLDNASSSKVSSKQKLEIELRSVFDKVDGNKSGRISARELSSALLNFDHTRFQDSTILLMVKLFSTSGSPSTSSKTLNFDQFVSLWKYLSAYKKLFITADTDRSGDISFGEFQKIIEQIGYKLNIDLVLHLFQKFSNKDLDNYDSGTVGKLKFDAFIELLVYLRKLTDIFKKYDKDLSGVATINFSDFLFEVSNLS